MNEEGGQNMENENKMKFEWGRFGLFVLSFALAVGIFAYFGRKTSKEALDSQNELSQNTEMEASLEKLKIEDIKAGTGEEAVSGKTITVHYTGTLTDGTKFDSSVDRNTPFTFTLGAGEVIQGWDSGFAGMKVGGKRKLTIPPELGYGASGAGDAVPPNSTLIFDVELLEVK